MWETQIRSLGREDPLEKEMATQFNILTWRIPRREEPGRLQSMGLQSRTGLSDFTFAFLNPVRGQGDPRPMTCFRSVDLDCVNCRQYISWYITLYPKYLLICALTSKGHEQFSELVEMLSPGLSPQGGSNKIFHFLDQNLPFLTADIFFH